MSGHIPHGTSRLDELIAKTHSKVTPIRKPPSGVFPGEFLSPRSDIAYRATGEWRAPKRGEYYLSGAIVCAYRAPNDFNEDDKFWIAERGLVKRTILIDFTPIGNSWEVHPCTLASLPETHTVWTRVFDGEQVFTVVRNVVRPGDGDGGYRTVEAALKQKGFIR